MTLSEQLIKMLPEEKLCYTNHKTIGTKSACPTCRRNSTLSEVREILSKVELDEEKIAEIIKLNDLYKKANFVGMTHEPVILSLAIKQGEILK